VRVARQRRGRTCLGAARRYSRIIWIVIGIVVAAVQDYFDWLGSAGLLTAIAHQQGTGKAASTAVRGARKLQRLTRACDSDALIGAVGTALLIPDEDPEQIVRSDECSQECDGNPHP
jgi:hypothetical protein